MDRGRGCAGSRGRRAGGVDGGAAGRAAAWAGATVCGVLLLVLSGCAARRPALPAVPSRELPGAWLRLLADRPCPDPFWARLRLRLEVPGQPGVTLEGMLRAQAPDTLRLTARLGPFRPVFALLANPDSAQILLHDAGEFWLVPRAVPDWAAMDPAAWSEALSWALCPARLLQRFEAEGPGNVAGSRWSVAGRLRGTPWGAALTMDTRTGALLSARVRGGEAVAFELTAGRHGSVGGAWLPGRMEIRRPLDGLAINIERVAGGKQDPGEITPRDLVRPPGWSELRGEIEWNFAPPPGGAR